MPLLTPTPELDAEALEHRVPSDRTGRHHLRPGHVVRNVFNDRVFRILEVNAFWGDAWDVGGHDIVVEELDERTGRSLEQDGDGDKDAESWVISVPTSTEHVVPFYEIFQPTGQQTLDGWLGNSPFVDTTPIQLEFESDAAFCECCDVHFDRDYVTWTFDDGAPSRFPNVERGSRFWHRFYWQHSSCRRCSTLNPLGKVLWHLVKRHVKTRAIALYWNAAAHHPRYLTRLEHEMHEDTGGAVSR